MISRHLSDFRYNLTDCRQRELFGVVFIDKGFEVSATAGFVDSSGSNNNELLALPEALSVDCRLAADHTDGRELGHLICECHEVGDGAKRFVGKGGVQSGEDDALAEMDEFKGERDDVGIEELNLVDADDVSLVDAVGAE